MGEVIRAGEDRGFTEGVNIEEELFACCDGKVYPITNWFGVDCQPCPKEEAAVAVAGRCFVWFTVPLAAFGVGPLAILGENEGERCGSYGCSGTLVNTPPAGDYGCSCHISPPCGWCVDHFLRCDQCDREC